jgi:C4-dicarboxylate-specific signal transduction histidine kinase
VARRLRHQFLLATVVLAVPILAVIAWAAEKTYAEHVAQTAAELDNYARIIALAIGTQKPDRAGLAAFLTGLDLPESAIVRVIHAADGQPLVQRPEISRDVFSETVKSRHADVPGQPLKVVVELPASVPWDRAVSVYERAMGIAGLGALLMLAIQAVFIGRWLRSVASFERAADRVGAGDLRRPPRSPMPSRELEHLRDAFGDMVDNLREAREAIARQVEEERHMRQELQSLQQQVIRQERLAAIGVLLSGIAHELNNPLQAISGFADLLQRDPDLRPSVHADLALIKKESARASAIIRNLSRFSRQQGIAPSDVYLRDVVASVVELRLRRFREQGIVLELDQQSDHATRAVFTELQQVLLNFVINAEQALVATRHDERRIVVRTRDLGNCVRLEVEDNGCGVPAENEAKLFQPFFTTKPMGEGTGLGLSVSYGIVRSFGGSIGYARGPAGGALFHFELPAEHIQSASA